MACGFPPFTAANPITKPWTIGGRRQPPHDFRKLPRTEFCELITEEWADLTLQLSSVLSTGAPRTPWQLTFGATEHTRTMPVFHPYDSCASVLLLLILIHAVPTTWRVYTINVDNIMFCIGNTLSPALGALKAFIIDGDIVSYSAQVRCTVRLVGN